MGSLSAVARGIGSATARGHGQVTAPNFGSMSPMQQSYDQWSFGRAGNTSLPRDFQTFLSGAFGPLAPIQPVGIDAPPDDAQRPMPRRWEYSVGWNMPSGVPGSEGLKIATYATLRSFADLYSVIRACVTNCINDVIGTEWDIQPTEQAEKAMHGDQKALDDFAKRREEALKFWSRPDRKYHTWQAWMRALLEDLFVIDAMALYIHPARGRGHGPFGSNMAGLDILDGSTIRPILDIRGGPPEPPDVAYQQYLWGVPRSDMSVPMLADDEGMTAELIDQFTGDQLLYLAMYERDHTPYGFSAVERALIPAATGLRRQVHALQFYSEGTLPAVYVTPGPDISTPQQIALLQRALNNIAGDQAWKHKVIVLPPGSHVDPQKTINLADQFDQVLAAEVTMAFEMTPLDIGVAPRVAAVQSPSASRDFAQTNTQNSQKRGLKPRLDFLKSAVFDFVMQRVWRQTDMEWRWTGMETGEDLTEKMTIWTGLVKNGIASIDQAAQEFGLEAWGLPETSVPGIITATGFVPLSSSTGGQVVAQGEDAPPPDEQLRGAHPAGAGPATPPVDTERFGGDPTPAHHAAGAAEEDAPETHAAVKAELEILGRYLRKGKDPAAFTSDVLPPEALKAASTALAGGIPAAVEAATVVVKLDRHRAGRDRHVAAAHRTVAGGLGRLVHAYRRGKLSQPQVIDQGVRVMADGYRQVMAAASRNAVADVDGVDTTIDVTRQADERAQGQRSYLMRLLAAVVGGLSVAAITARLSQYGDTLSGAYNAAYGQTVQAAQPGYEIVWHLGVAEQHCKLCVARDGKTFTFDSLPGYPGDGDFGGQCLGGPNCSCSLEYRQAGRSLATGTNTQRDAAIPYYQSQLDTITAARESAARAREDFLAGIPEGPAARAHTRDSIRQELADQANQRIRSGGGYPGVSVEPSDIPAAAVAARVPASMKSTTDLAGG